MEVYPQVSYPSVTFQKSSCYREMEVAFKFNYLPRMFIKSDPSQLMKHSPGYISFPNSWKNSKNFNGDGKSIIKILLDKLNIKYCISIPQIGSKKE